MKWDKIFEDATFTLIIILLVLASVLSWGNPDLIDGLIWWLSDGALIESACPEKNDAFDG